MISVTWNSQLITAEAKADLLCNSSDITRWEHQFIPALTEAFGVSWYSMTFDGVNAEPADNAYLELDGGEWRIEQNSGDFNTSGNNISVHVDGSLQYVFADPGLTETLLVSVPYGQMKTITAFQTQSRFASDIYVRKLQTYETNGENPQVSATGDQLTVKIGNNGNTPNNGVLTATPKVYNTAGTEVASGNSISMIINVSSSGGC